MLDELERELERVRAYRADVPEPDAAVAAAARMQLLEAIASETPVATPQSSVARRPFFVSFVRHYVQNSQGSRREPEGAQARSQARARLGRLQRRRRFVLAGGLATLGVGVAGVLGLTTAATPVSALAAQMNQLASVAASQTWTGIPGPGQYIYTQSQALTEADTMGDGQECVVSQVEHRQIWIATDGSGAISDTRDQSQFTSAADQATCAAMKITDPSSQNSSWSNRFPAGGLSLPTNDWKSLSTDPQTLLTQVHERDGGPNTPAEWFANIADFMRESDVPAGIRAALYQATALIPGVKLLGMQTDPTGQSGLAVGYYDGGQLSAELIFDQQSARLLAEQYYGADGKLASWTAYTDQQIVNSVPNYPMAASGFERPPVSAGQSGTSTTSTGQPTTATGASTTTTGASTTSSS